MPAKPALVAEGVGNILDSDVSRVREQRPKADAGKGCYRAIGTHTTSKTVEICWAQFPPVAVVATGTGAATSLRDHWAEPPAWWRALPPWRGSPRLRGNFTPQGHRDAAGGRKRPG